MQPPDKAAATEAFPRAESYVAVRSSDDPGDGTRALVYYIILYYIILHYIILYYIILYYITVYKE